MLDISIYETGSGGDAILKGNDVELTSSLFNMVYLAFFGGNPSFLTSENQIESELRGDWWGNNVFFQDAPELQFNSLTEHTLNTTALDSNGRITIERNAKKDLEFLADFAEYDVNVSIPDVDKVNIFVTLTEPGNTQEKEFQFIWDATRNEVIEQKIL